MLLPHWCAIPSAFCFQGNKECITSQLSCQGRSKEWAGSVAFFVLDRECFIEVAGHQTRMYSEALWMVYFSAVLKACMLVGAGCINLNQSGLLAPMAEASHSIRSDCPWRIFSAFSPRDSPMAVNKKCVTIGGITGSRVAKCTMGCTNSEVGGGGAENDLSNFLGGSIWPASRGLC